MTTKNFQPPTREEIARYAYCLWESEGQIHGRDLDYWLQAEAHLIAAREDEAGLLKPVLFEENAIKKAPTVATPNIASRPAKLPRRRQSRLIQEAVCA
jgi:hypothetical protein